ncbi:DUF2807 domain-containing protein [Pedobacter sp. PAMC26386]|nr:DUF2807 domain-containing protein [Pedobacter sp. PAMC26386]
MKTAIKTLFATALTAIVLTSSAFTTFAKEGDKSSSAINTSYELNMVKVNGNVQVYLSLGAKENIRVETNQPEARVSLKRIGEKLLISSTEENMVTVYLTVKSLSRIDAADKAIVKTNGHFNLENLQIFLQDDAQVNVDATALDIYTVIKDGASLKLSGSTDRLISIKDEASKLNTNKLIANSTISSTPVFAKIDLDAQFAESLNLASLTNSATK